MIFTALVCATILGADPEISGPAQIKANHFGAFEVKGLSPSAANDLYWDVYPWLDADQIIEDGATVKLVAPPGNYKLQARGKGENGKRFTARKEFAVVDQLTPIPPPPGPGPTPPGPTPPGPVPPTPPGPIIPDGKYKLARIAYDAAISLPDVTVDGKNRAAQARALAEGLRAVAADAATKRLTVAQIFATAKAARAAALGNASTAWDPWYAAVVAALNALKLKPVGSEPEIIIAYRELANGLDLVK